MSPDDHSVDRPPGSGSEEQAPLVLVVDDNSEVAQAHAGIVKQLGYRVLVEENSLEAARLINLRSDIELVLLDLQMPQMSGMDLLRRIKLRRPSIGVIMATVVNEIDQAVLAIHNGAYNYLLKPLTLNRLGEVIASYFQNYSRLVYREGFPGLVTQSARMNEVFQRMRAFCDVLSPVLIEGETGTGKEVVAQLLHAISSRAAEPFVALNVAALPAELFEAELFGYAKGAFTGALNNKEGYLEAAGKGTLFLDEIGELPLEQQTKLLRVLETRSFRRVGETRERELRAKIVCATNRGLKEDAEQGAFRKDLYYRLAHHGIELPPLRERRGDVELLANYFLEKYCSQYGRQIQALAPEAMSALERYSFPGNVRELEGLISSCVLLESQPYIQPSTLPHHVTEAVPVQGEVLQLEHVRYRTIMNALEECGGNQTHAAKRLGIARGTLNRLLRQYREGGGPDGAV